MEWPGRHVRASKGTVWQGRAGKARTGRQPKEKQMPKKMVYEFATGSRFPVDAQTAGERLEQIRKRHGGNLTAVHVVNDSRKPAAPLHNCFEWDDPRAAEMYRCEQARSLIRSVRICIPVQGSEDCNPVRAFVHVTEGEDRHYTSTAVAMSDDALRQQVLQAAWRELESFRRRYREFQELADVLNIIADVLPEKAA